jgi:hypothetical protein
MLTREEIKTRNLSQLGRPRNRWEDDIRMDLGKTGWEGVDCTHLAQDRD